MNTLAAETASAWYLILNRKLQTLPIYITQLSSHLPRPLTMGTQQVSAGAAVITPQHRSYRVPQGSPQVFGGPWGSIFKPPCSHRAKSATILLWNRRSLRSSAFITSLTAPSSRRFIFAHTWVYVPVVLSIRLSTNHESLSQPIMKIGYWLHYFFHFSFCLTIVLGRIKFDCTLEDLHPVCQRKWFAFEHSILSHLLWIARVAKSVLSRANLLPIL